MQEATALGYLAHELQPIIRFDHFRQVHLTVVVQDLKLLLARRAIFEERSLVRTHQFRALNGTFQNGG